MTDLSHPPLENLPAWARLQSAPQRLGGRSTLDLFATDGGRVEAFCVDQDGLHLDFSKQRVDREGLADLLQLAREAALPRGIEALFGGAGLNHTEGRPALHVAMRDTCLAPAADQAQVAATQQRMLDLVADLWAGRLGGSTGQPIRHVINLGIGGSDLGPRMAVEALASPAQPGPADVRFVANIDPRDFQDSVAGLDPARCLFIVSSKSFSTAETLSNATAARAWLGAGLGAGADLSCHFLAVSNAVEAATRFGISAARILPLPEWVGGRFSVWSAIGLPLAAAIGVQGFKDFLAGGQAMDRHFRAAPLEANLPVLMALLGLWNSAVLGAESLAVLPYAHGLRSFPAYLQQLDMESNGKRVRADGSPVPGHTAPIVWGGAGTQGQHAFHQLFYQGTRRVPMDFIVPVGDDSPAQRGLVENALAQSAALMAGRNLASAQALLQGRGIPAQEVARLAPHLVCPGNQPSSTLLLAHLTPFTLGQLVALYEHKVFVQGWLWGINSFDQYGVELGKEMARSLASGQGGAQDPSTASLSQRIARLQSSR